MSNIPAVDEGLIQEEETVFKAAVSEYAARRVGSNLNFIRTYSHVPSQFKINGRYNTGITLARIDGFIYFEFNAEIIDIVVLNGTAGSGSTTELNVYRYVTSGGSGTSIFSTTPKITSAAGDNVKIQIGSSVTGTTAPVLTSSPNRLAVNAGDWLECKMITTMSGSPRDIQLVVVWRPR